MLIRAADRFLYACADDQCCSPQRGVTLGAAVAPGVCYLEFTVHVRHWRVSAEGLCANGLSDLHGRSRQPLANRAFFPTVLFECDGPQGSEVHTASTDAPKQVCRMLQVWVSVWCPRSAGTWSSSLLLCMTWAVELFCVIGTDQPGLSAGDQRPRGHRAASCCRLACGGWC